MAERPKSDGETRDTPGRGSARATPRWVKGFGIIGIALVVLFVILHLTGHGFGHHMPMPAPEPGAPRS